MDLEAAEHGEGLTSPVELLDHGRIVDRLGSAASLLGRLEILEEIPSTNSYLLDKGPAGLAPGTGHACLAESQSAGRGRNGRRWASPFGCNIYLSLLWQFSGPPRALSALGVASAVAVVRALKALGVDGLELKWPNDIHHGGRKLGGVLLELCSDQHGPRWGVIGVGLNVRMPAADAGTVDQPWTDVHTALGHPVSRNELAALVLQQLLYMIEAYESAGPAAFIDEWRRHDPLPGRPAVLQWPRGEARGIVAGISPTGELMLTVDGETRHYAYGELSLRAAD